MQSCSPGGANVHIGASWRIRLNCPSSAALRGLMSNYFDHLFMVALCNRETIYIFMLWFVMVALCNRETIYILWSPYVIGRPYIFLPCSFFLLFFLA